MYTSLSRRVLFCVWCERKAAGVCECVLAVVAVWSLCMRDTFVWSLSVCVLRVCCLSLFVCRAMMLLLPYGCLLRLFNWNIPNQFIYKLFKNIKFLLCANIRNVINYTQIQLRHTNTILHGLSYMARCSVKICQRNENVKVIRPRIRWLRSKWNASSC